MSFRLVDEVLAHAPDDLSLGERVVLLVISHRAHEATRECRLGMTRLVAETGMHQDSIRRALTRLERRGLRLRATKPGPDHCTVYRVPTLGPLPDVASDRSESTAGRNVRSFVGERPDATSTTVGRKVGEPSDATSALEGHERDSKVTPPKTPPDPAAARCARHAGQAEPVNCFSCRTAKESATRELATYRADLERRKQNCDRCDGVWLVDPDNPDKPLREKCDHAPLLEVVGE